jgi:hypothetical protein
MNRKNAAPVKSRAPEKTPKRRKPGRGKNPGRSSKKITQNPALAGVRPPPPGKGKRGEKGYLA